MSRHRYLNHKEVARALVKSRLEYYNQFYGFVINRIAIKNHKSRWGSCSKKGNLNFNWRLVLLPLEMVDYVVVHELCHLGQFNHSPNFWKLIAQSLPNYKEIKKKFKVFRIL